jgi:hypothetical protein
MAENAEGEEKDGTNVSVRINVDGGHLQCVKRQGDLLYTQEVSCLNSPVLERALLDRQRVHAMRDMTYNWDVVIFLSRFLFLQQTEIPRTGPR